MSEHEHTHWTDKKHWLVAVWPANEDGSFSEHHNWRTAIIHADTEEEIMRNLALYLVPTATPFRVWMMEMTADNAREGIMNITTEFKEK